MSNKFLSGQGSGDIIQFLKNNVVDARAAIQLVPNGTIQSYDATLQSLANLSTTSNKLIKSTGTDQFTTISISTQGENALVSSEALLTSSHHALFYDYRNQILKSHLVSASKRVFCSLYRYILHFWFRRFFLIVSSILVISLIPKLSLTYSFLSCFFVLMLCSCYSVTRLN